MATLLEQAIKVLRGLPQDEQNLAASAVIDYARRDDELALSHEDVAEVRRRMTSQRTLLSIDEVRACLDA